MAVRGCWRGSVPYTCFLSVLLHNIYTFTFIIFYSLTAVAAENTLHIVNSLPRRSHGHRPRKNRVNGASCIIIICMCKYAYGIFLNNEILFFVRQPSGAVCVRIVIYDFGRMCSRIYVYSILSKKSVYLPTYIMSTATIHIRIFCKNDGRCK